MRERVCSTICPGVCIVGLRLVSLSDETAAHVRVGLRKGGEQCSSTFAV